MERSNAQAARRLTLLQEEHQRLMNSGDEDDEDGDEDDEDEDSDSDDEVDINALYDWRARKL